MAALPPSRVHQGFWVDYTKGSILGAVITTTSADANLVIAVLSLLVTFAGSHLWDLIAFAGYCAGVSTKPRRMLHHQIQMLVRNITSPGAFLLETSKVCWSWRCFNISMWRILLLFSLALLCSAGFLVAGIFVSQIVSSSNIQVLAQSKFCGSLDWHNESTSRHREYQQLVFRQALAYSETCYTNMTREPQCNLYAKQEIPIRSILDVERPFRGMNTTDSALRLDTGLLDSNEVFGINTDSKLRVSMRRVLTCAPLDLNGFSTIRPMPQDYLDRYHHRRAFPGEQLYEWSVGELVMNLRPFNSTIWVSNYTAIQSKIFDLTPRAFYLPVVDNRTGNWHNSTFTPIPELRHEAADTHIMAVQNNGVAFYLPNDDPLFAAHRQQSVYFDTNANITMYFGDRPASFLGCAEQLQFCFAEGSCTSLTGVDPAYNQAQLLAPTSQQKAILYHLFLRLPTMYGAASAPMLVTRSAISYQLGISSQQWKYEALAWFRYLLAIMQTTIPHIAAGPGIVRTDFDELTQPVEWPGLCHAQRMGAPDGFSNINALGLGIVTSLSGLIIVINLSLTAILKYLYQHGRLSSTRMKSWVLNGMLQVQREAYEGVGHSPWTWTNIDVPLLKDDALVFDLGQDSYKPRANPAPAPVSSENANQEQSRPISTMLGETLRRQNFRAASMRSSTAIQGGRRSSNASARRASAP